MRVLTRYLLRSHVGPFFFALVALTSVVLLNTLAKELANLAGKGLPTRVFFEFFYLSLPANLALTLPMSVLVAVLYTVSQMAAENEIMALKASGVDLRRAFLPLLVAATFIAGGMVWFNDQVLPASNYRWRMLMMDVAQTSPLILLQPQVINPIKTADGVARYYLRAGRIEEAGNRLRDVTIYDVSNADVARTIYADSGRIAFNETQTDLILTLYSGHIREVQLSQPETFQSTRFQRQLLRMAGVSQRLERTTDSNLRTDRDMTGSMMRAEIDTLHVQISKLQAQASKPIPPSAGIEPTTTDVAGEPIPYLQARIKSLHTQIREYQTEIQNKYSIAAAALVFVLIGVPIALRFARGGVGMVIGVSLAIFSIYYVGLIAGESLADQGYMPPWLAMWLTNLVFGALGVVGLWRVGREQSTGRGSGWGDLPRWLRPRGARRAARVAEAEG
jgi:lipopolysaccharide export system permease protein